MKQVLIVLLGVFSSVSAHALYCETDRTTYFYAKHPLELKSYQYYAVLQTEVLREGDTPRITLAEYVKAPSHPGRSISFYDAPIDLMETKDGVTKILADNRDPDLGSRFDLEVDKNNKGRLKFKFHMWSMFGADITLDLNCKPL